MMHTDLAIGIAGAGGDGVILLGELLSKAVSKAGLNVVLTKSFGPQIRGGESSSRIRVSDKRLSYVGDKIDALLVFHWADLQRFRSELVLKRNAVIIVDEADKTPDEEIPIPEHYKSRIRKVPFEQIAVDTVKTKQAKNMVMAGVVCELFNWPDDGIEDYIRTRFTKKSQELVDLNIQGVEAGRQYVRDNLNGVKTLKLQYDRRDSQIFISGNDAFAFGCLCAGCRFMAGYPITPASEVLEFMARELPRFDGVCVQAEDEISAMCMTVGASFGGIKSMTVTSGPGLSLKQEAIGLAVIAELPVVIGDVQRGGPSTGLPTRTEQSDLNIAIYGGHGDCPRVVLAATDVRECYEMAHTAFDIAERYQTPVIVLLDQYLGHSLMSVEGINIRHFDPKDNRKWYVANYRPELWKEEYGSLEEYRDKEVAWRRFATPDELRNEVYKRYALTDNGVSPITVPGMPGGEHTAVGIEHAESGNPSSSHVDHQAQSEKRFRKFAEIARHYRQFDKAGEEYKPKLGILTWGSTFGVCAEICELMIKAGLPTQVIAPTILYPLPFEDMQEWLNGLDQLITVETNYGDQFYHYIKAFLDMPQKSYHYSRAGGIPMRLSEVLNFILYNIELPDDFELEYIQERLSW
jgi:2-oxoglutarate ferredoxin oxidoreductase subunit alpha